MQIFPPWCILFDPHPYNQAQRHKRVYSISVCSLGRSGALFETKQNEKYQKVLTIPLYLSILCHFLHFRNQSCSNNKLISFFTFTFFPDSFWCNSKNKISNKPWNYWSKLTLSHGPLSLNMLVITTATFHIVQRISTKVFAWTYLVTC